jgi:heat shock protein HslJ
MKIYCNYLILSLFLLSWVGTACHSTKNVKVPPPNFALASEQGWTWTQRPPLEEGGKPYNLFFEAENSYTIYLDVNSCFGEYKKGDDQTLILPDYASCTEICCDKEHAMDFVNAFHKSKSYAIHGDTLILSGGEKALYFLPAKAEKTGE